MREAKNEGGRGGGRGGGGRGYGRGRGGGSGFNRDSNNSDTTYGSNNGFSGGYRPSEEGDVSKPSEKRGYVGPRGGYRGGRRGGFSNGEAGEGERPRRSYERRSGTGRGLVFVVEIIMLLYATLPQLVPILKYNNVPVISIGMRSNVMELVVVIGELPLMKLLREYFNFPEIFNVLAHIFSARQSYSHLWLHFL